MAEKALAECLPRLDFHGRYFFPLPHQTIYLIPRAVLPKIKARPCALIQGAFHKFVNDQVLEQCPFEIMGGDLFGRF